MKRRWVALLTCAVLLCSMLSVSAVLAEGENCATPTDAHTVYVASIYMDGATPEYIGDVPLTYSETGVPSLSVKSVEDLFALKERTIDVKRYDYSYGSTKDIAGEHLGYTPAVAEGVPMIRLYDAPKDQNLHVLLALSEVAKKEDAEKVTSEATGVPTVEPTTELAVEEPTEESTTEPTVEPTTEPVVEEPTEESTTEPTVEPTTEPTVEEPTEESTTEPTEEPTTEPVVEEPTEESTTEPTEEPTTEPVVKEPTEESTTEPTVEPTTEPVVEEPTDEPTTEPTEEPTTEPVVEEPTDEPTTEPTVEPTTEPVVEESTNEPTTEPTVEPTTEPVVVEPTAEPTAEPARAKLTVRIEIVEPKDEYFYGDEFTMRAVVENAISAVTYQWEVLLPGAEDWQAIEGAVEDTYTFVITEENAQNQYHVKVVETEEQGE